MNPNEYYAFSRRRFLASAALGTAAAVAGPGLPNSALAAEKRWKMKLSCSTICFSKLPIEQAIERIAKLGFESVDIWSAHAGCPHLDDVQTRLGADGLKEVLEKNKVKLYAFSVYHGGYPKYAELLGKAGGGIAIHGCPKGGNAKELTARMKNAIESLKGEVELAEKYDSYVAVENHGGSLLNSLDSFKAFADINKSPRLGIALAPYHLQRAKASIEEAIAISGKHLLFFYAWQAAKGTGQLPGVGPADCTPWIAALAKAGYQWYVNPFMHHEPEPDEMAKLMAKSCDYLNECYAKAVPA